MIQTTGIHDLLRMSLAEYEMDYLQRFMRWCMTRSKKDAENVNYDDLQKLMANARISRWYDSEFAKLEAAFS
nr:hypothetical protein [Flavobacterium sp.]